LAFLSSANPNDVNRALFFVHGFAGKATTTWADFLSLADDRAESDWWQYSDLFFYDYHRASIREQIPDNARDLFKFLERMFLDPPFELFNRPEADLALRPKGFGYSEMYLVGHSEGGLLSRHAILHAAEKDSRLDEYLKAPPPKEEPEPKGLLKAKLRLFAPAISGTIFTGILGLIARLPVMEMGAAAVSPAKEGLKVDAPPVSIARNETKEKALSFKMECFRAHIMWARKDWVVHKVKYPTDEECEAARTKHTTVCKPNRAFRLPLKFVQEGVESCAE
jgi:pimeloyl-ACP methyl ester carboxylesterase